MTFHMPPPGAFVHLFVPTFVASGFNTATDSGFVRWTVPLAAQAGDLMFVTINCNNERNANPLPTGWVEELEQLNWDGGGRNLYLLSKTLEAGDPGSSFQMDTIGGNNTQANTNMVIRDWSAFTISAFQFGAGSAINLPAITGAPGVRHIASGVHIANTDRVGGWPNNLPFARQDEENDTNASFVALSAGGTDIADEFDPGTVEVEGGGIWGAVQTLVW